MKDDTRTTRKQAVFRRNISLLVSAGLLITAIGVYYGTPFIDKQVVIEGPIEHMKTLQITIVLLGLLGLGMFITFITIMFWIGWAHDNKGLVGRK